MVKVRTERPTDHLGRLDVETWLDRISSHVKSEKFDDICRAARYVCDITKTQDDESILLKSMAMADILIQFKVDETTLVATLLYPLAENELSSDFTLKDQYPEHVARLIKGAVMVNEVRSKQVQADGVTKFTDVEKLRKMLVAMVDDVRVILIKLAEQVFVLREARKSDDREDKRLLGRETMDVYAPLANRLGIGQLCGNLRIWHFDF